MTYINDKIYQCEISLDFVKEQMKIEGVIINQSIKYINEETTWDTCHILIKKNFHLFLFIMKTFDD